MGREDRPRCSPLQEDELEKYLLAGKIAKKVKKHILDEKKELLGKNYLSLCEEVEKLIFELGGRPAFPVNICPDFVAAHETARIEDERKLKEETKLLKIDLGVHIDGYIVDTAITLVFDKNYEYLRKAAEEALMSAIDIIKPNVEVRKIGKVIYEKVKEFGCSPVVNLVGHQMKRYILHTGLSIPNYDNKDTRRLKEGMVIAIEPFTTNKRGYAIEGYQSEIFSLRNLASFSERMYRDIYIHIKKYYKLLPFAARWLVNKGFEKRIVKSAIPYLHTKNIIKSYPTLVEIERGLVAQAEHTIIVQDPPIVLT